MGGGWLVAVWNGVVPDVGVACNVWAVELAERIGGLVRRTRIGNDGVHELAEVGAARLGDRAEDERGGGVRRDNCWIGGTGRCEGAALRVSDKIGYVKISPDGPVDVEEGGASRGDAV